MVELSLLENSIEPVAGNIVNGVGAGAEQVGNTAMQLAGNPAILVGGIALIIIAILVFYFLKKIIINSALGVAAWLILTFVFNVELPFIPSLAISIIFGLAGIGAMLVMKFFGLF